MLISFFFVLLLNPSLITVVFQFNEFLVYKKILCSFLHLLIDFIVFQKTKNLKKITLVI
jgi:hypothetical protein